MNKIVRSVFAALALGACLSPATSRAQALPVIPNAGFETWTPRTAGPITYQAPQDWEPGLASSLFLAFGIAPGFDQSTTVAHSGTSSLHITLGPDSLGGDLEGIFPATSVPQTLSVWARNSRVLANPDEAGILLAVFTRTQGGVTDTVAIGGGPLGTTAANQWEQFSGNIVTLMTAAPDEVTFYIGNPGGLANFELWVDDIAFSNAMATADAAPTAAPLSLSPNPASATGAAVTLMVPARSASRAVLTVTDVAGRTTGRVRTHDLQPGENTLSVPTAGLPAGTYVVTLLSAEGTRTTRLVVE